jgi:hypothetical protein
MDSTSQSSFMPPLRNTPRVVKGLLLIIGSLSLLWGLSEMLFPTFFSETMHPLFSLNYEGMSKSYFWQLITFSLIEPVSDSFTIFYLLHLAFILYIFWVVSYSLFERKGFKHLLTLYLLGTLSAGLAATFAMKAFSIYTSFLSSQVPLYTFLFAWMVMNPRAKLYLFLSIPISFPFLLLGIWGMNLLIDLSHGKYLSFTAHLTAGVVGYLYAIIAWQMKSHLSFLEPFEKLFLRKNRRTGSGIPNAKIYDFQTGAPMLTDAEFMDAMLAKISKVGEGSLTRDEKKRMKVISKKKNLQKNPS